MVMADQQKRKKNSDICPEFLAFYNGGISEINCNVLRKVEDSASEDFSDATVEPKDIVKIKSKRKRKKIDALFDNKVESSSENLFDTSDESEGEKKKKTDHTIDKESVFYNEEMDFTDLYISRPLIKALKSMDLIHPTPIQAATIPEALMGKDILGCAATGTGKTAAFMLPVLERLLKKPGGKPVTRVLVMLPTRELAVQVYQVSRQLAQFTNVEISLSTGGLDVKSQEVAIRKIPDIIIATPGRLIDHLLNTPSFSLRRIEILILDEADRMLDEYFAQQMKEIIKQCCSKRQTMLFSATMTDQVNDLSAVSLKNPVKIFINSNTEVALNLQQEFVRIRATREADREAILSALVCRTFCNCTLVFVQTKKQVHRLYVMLGLLGIKVAELHGNLNQIQRLESLQQFKEQTVDVLVATDVAARGLDIERVKTVINFSLPGTLQHYIHRVGRTARAGKGGRSVSLVGEKERVLLRQIRKKTNNPITQRLVPPEIVAKFKDKINGLEAEIEASIHKEREQKALKDTEKKVKIVEELLNSNSTSEERERKWFQTPQERKKEQDSMRLAVRTKRKKIFRKQNAEDRIDHEVQKAIDYSVRAAKRMQKPKRIRAFSEENEKQFNKKKKKHVSKKSFEDELADTSRRSVKKFRYEATQHEKLERIKKKKKVPSKKFKSKSRYRRKK